MDNQRQRRGELFVDKEDTEKAIERVTKELKKQGAAFAEFGRALSSTPEQVVFTNAPDNLGSVTGHYLGSSHKFNWQEFSNIVPLAEQIQELRRLKLHLEDIDRQLSSFR